MSRETIVQEEATVPVASSPIVLADVDDSKHVSFAKEISGPRNAKEKADLIKMREEKARKREEAKKKASRHERAVEEATRRKEIEKTVFLMQEALLDTRTPIQLIESSDFLTPESYADVVQERSIASMCGYPLCKNSLKVKRNKMRGEKSLFYNTKKYKINFRDKKVYDMEAIEMFCGNHCHIASDFFSTQLLSVSVHLRTGSEIVKENLFLVMNANECNTKMIRAKVINGKVLVGLQDLRKMQKYNDVYTHEDVYDNASMNRRNGLNVGDGIVGGSSKADDEHSDKLEQMMRDMNVREIFGVGKGGLGDGECAPMPSQVYQSDTYAVDGFVPAMSTLAPATLTISDTTAKDMNPLDTDIYTTKQSQRTEDMCRVFDAEVNNLAALDTHKSIPNLRKFTNTDADDKSISAPSDETCKEERKTVKFAENVSGKSEASKANISKIRKLETSKTALSLYAQTWLVLSDWKNTNVVEFLCGMKERASNMSRVETSFDPMTDDWESIKNDAKNGNELNSQTESFMKKSESRAEDYVYRQENYDPIVTRRNIVLRQLAIVLKNLLRGKRMNGCTYDHVRFDLGELVRLFSVVRSHCVYLNAPVDSLIGLVLIEALGTRNPYIAAACAQSPKGSPFALEAMDLFDIDAYQFDSLVASMSTPPE
eukprot:CFRG4614T1